MPKKTTNKHTCTTFDSIGLAWECTICKKRTCTDCKPQVTQRKDGNPDCVCGEELKIVENWEKEFDATFGVRVVDFKEIGKSEVFSSQIPPRIVKVFIKSLLKKQAKEVREGQKRIDAEIVESIYNKEDRCPSLKQAKDAILNTNKES